MPALPASDDRDHGRLLFRFAVLGDTHINPVEGESPSPWPTNGEANTRARAATREVNRLEPDFVVHMGDMVHPVPAQDTYQRAVANAQRIFAELRAPVHYVPGNHDMGDKAVEWMPASIVNEAFIDSYERCFGPDHYVFRHNGCRFVVINAQLLNSGLERESQQWSWLEEEFARNTRERTFLFTHYPPYIADADEIEHYDNTGEPARSRLLGLVQGAGVEAVIGAHVHNFFYDRREGCDFYVMPAISAIRHDYSEIFRVPPEDSEFGRNDNAKLGFFVFDVYEHGHVPHYVRSYGAAEAENGRPATGFVVPRTNSRLAGGSPMGVDLRQAWGKAETIPYAGGVDEFYRKAARNDYFLAGLWEAGIRRLRIPAEDLLDAEVRARMQTMRELGHEFLLFSYDAPQGALANALAAHRGLVGAVEVILPRQRASAAIGRLAELQRRTGADVFLSKLRSSADAKAAGAKYTHFIAHGLGAGEERHAGDLLREPGAEALAGFSFRIESADDPAERIVAIAGWAERQGVEALIHVTLADTSPASMPRDEAAIANRVASALFAAHATMAHCRVFLDTFADMDRGYFPRLGLVDRRFNPRAASRMAAGLQALLCGLGPLSPAPGHEIEGGRILAAEDKSTSVELVLPALRVPFACLLADGEAALPARTFDVESGEEVSPNSATPEWVDRPVLVIRSRSTGGESRDGMPSANA